MEETASVNNVVVGSVLVHRLNKCKVEITKIDNMVDVGRVFYFRYVGGDFTGEYLLSHALYNFNLTNRG